MPRRLPLLRPPAALRPVDPLLGRERIPLGPASLGIADTESGAAAAAFAVDLARALAARSATVTIVLLGFQGLPRLPEALARALADAGIALEAFAVDAEHPVVPSWPQDEERGLRLWLGLPALTAFAPACSILLGADRPLTSWPAPLRAQRGSFTLELSSARVGLPPMLAGSLNEHGFLLRR